MSILEKHLLNQIPCAVIVYEVWLKTSKKKIIGEHIADAKSNITTQYEVLFIDRLKQFRTQVLSKDEVQYFISNREKFTVAARENDGVAYEFNGFKKYKESLRVKHK
jgi:hypothetical protein